METSRTRFHQQYRAVTAAVLIALLAALFPPAVPTAAATNTPPIPGMPQGLPFNAPMLQATAPDLTRQPLALANPITVSRIQSAPTAADALSNTLTLTYTIRNNMPPVNVPSLPEGATVTDTIEAAASFDYANDPNTVRSILLTNDLRNAEFVSATPEMTRQGSQLAWSLTDIPPLSTLTATLTVRLTGSSGEFTPIDVGATAWGTLRGRAVSAQAIPAQIVADSFAQWLRRTPDADTLDEYMLERAAEVGGDPERLFAYVRSLVGFESYSGSLRGTRGTLWSEAGNALDQASLLIAMLRAHGVPARYRHGMLSTARAQELILSMFPTPQGVIGHIPPGTEVSDPANDPVLLAETRDHWWVEAYLPGQGWRELDPSFASATVGQRFASSVATDGTDQVAEVPDAIRHKVTVRLKVEHYTPFSSTLPGGLPVTYPLSTTFNSVALVGEPVTLAHLVNQTGVGGLVFTTSTTDYRSYLIVGDEIIEGETYQDVVSNFAGGLGNRVSTGAWLLFDARSPNGDVETYERELVDRLGFAGRQGGSNLDLGALGNSPMFNTFDLMSILAAPGAISPSVSERLIPEALASQQAMARLWPQVNGSGAQGTPSQDAITELQDNLVTGLGAALMRYYATYDDLAPGLSASLLTKAYADSPRLVTLGLETMTAGTTATTTVSVDLVEMDLRTIPRPGQNVQARFSANFGLGLMAGAVESSLLEGFAPSAAERSVQRVFEVAEAAGIPSIALDQANLAQLAQLELSDEAKARIQKAVQRGLTVVVPEQMVQLGTATTIGWYEINPVTGQVVDTMENGRHLLGYALLLRNARVTGGAAAIVAASLTVLYLGVFGFIAIASASCENLRPVIVATGGTITFIARSVRAYLGKINPKAELIIELGVIVVTTALGVYAAKRDNACRRGPLPSGSKPDSLSLADSGPSDPAATVGAGSAGKLLFRPVLGSAESAPIKAPIGQTTGAPQTGAVSSLASLLIDGAEGTTGPISTAARQPQVAASLPTAGISGSVSSASLVLTAPAPTALYAPALLGIGAGGNGAPYGASSFGTGVNTTLSGANLMIGPAAGTLTLGGDALAVANGLAIAGYSGALTVAEASPTTDQVELSSTGPVSLFTLNLSDTTSTTDPDRPVSFNTQIAANFTDTYTVTAEAPKSWDVVIDAAGAITATPAPGAAPGDYQILVTAQSGLYPDLFVSAIHTVTTTVFDGVSVQVQPDILITVPWGTPVGDTPFGDTNNGQIQMTGAAFTASITNTSTIEREFQVSVSGLPAGWLILSGAPGGATATTITLPAGAAGQVGIYISPPPDALPAAGASFGFSVQVTATDNPAISQTDTATFTVPAIPYAYLTAEPALIYSTPGGTTSFDLRLRNVGTGSGSFPVSTELPTTTWSLSGLTNSVAVGAGQTNRQRLTLQTPGGEVGDTFTVQAVTRSGAYTQTAVVVVEMVSPRALASYQAAQDLTGPRSEALAAALANLGDALDQLTTPTDAAQRERVAEAIQQIANLLAPVPGLAATRTELLSIAQALRDAITATEVDAALARLDAALAGLPAGWNASVQYDVATRFSPGALAARPGDTVAVELLVDHQGTQRGDYRVTLSGPIPGLPAPQTITLNPGQVQSIPLSLSPTALGLARLRAEVVAVDGAGDPLGITAQATASLNFVDAFVRVLEVGADPPFVETGVSSTTLRVLVANVANIARPVVAATTVISPDGTIVVSDEQPFNLRTGDPSSYDLATLDTSGFASGVYTVSVELRDTTGTVIPEGRGFGYVTVGQGLSIDATAAPTVVVPGTSTVTTTITTTVRQGAVIPTSGRTSTAPLAARQSGANPTSGNNGSRLLTVNPGAGLFRGVYRTAMLPGSFGPTARVDDSGIFFSTGYSGPLAPVAMPPVAPGQQATGTGITRYEQTDPGFTFTGSWGARNETPASGGSVSRASTAGASASFSFTGSWVNLGLVTGSFGGQAEVSIDGVTRGVIDTYSRVLDVTSVIYRDLGDGPHTLTVTVLGTANALSSNTFVYLDYLDVWDGGVMAEGTFEENDPRVRLSEGWLVSTSAAASGGSYVWELGRPRFEITANAWYAFTGDSVTFQPFISSNRGQARIAIDGEWLGSFDLTGPLSFGNLGPGPHVLVVQAYRDYVQVDAFVTPATTPFYVPPDRTGVARYEEDDPALRYNDLPLGTTTNRWEMLDFDNVSGGYVMRSATAGDSISLSFEGSWVSVGFYTSASGGQAEVFIDGVSRGVVDTYSRTADVSSRVYRDLGPGAHTISIQVLGTRSPFATNSYVSLDYLDVWGGGTMPEGTFEESDPRVQLSEGWLVSTSTAASGGSYVWELGRPAFDITANAWFAFTGESATFQPFISANQGQARIAIDGEWLGSFDLTGPLSFGNLGPGPHVLVVQAYRDYVQVDAFVTPATTPFYVPPDRTGVARYEEDDPALRYNDLPLGTTTNRWEVLDFDNVSGGYVTRSATAGDSISLSFEGSWVSVSFYTSASGGQAEVFIDGVSQGVVDTYSRTADVSSRVYRDLGPGTHTVSIETLGTRNVLATNSYVALDYIDVWDGREMPDGTFEQNDERVELSGGWIVSTNAAATAGSYVFDIGNPGIPITANAWIAFTGESITFQPFVRSDSQLARIAIDGQWLGSFSLNRPLSFNNLAPGPHVLLVQAYRGLVTIDTFVTPGVAPFYTPPARTGAVRYEEDDPGLRFNGAPLATSSRTWSADSFNWASSTYAAFSGTSGDSVSLDFAGAWVNVGFLTRPSGGQAEVLIDGVSQGIVDTYTVSDDILNRVYANLDPGPHTVTIRVLGTRNPASTANTVRIDFIDAADGNVIDQRLYESDDPLVYRSANWSTAQNIRASGGSHLANGTNMWFPFTGDSVTLVAVTDPSRGSFEVFIDEISQGVVTPTYPFSGSPEPITFSGFGPGAHILRIRNVDQVRIDAFVPEGVQFRGSPRVEWSTTTPVLTSISAGDINGDGIVEVVTSSTDQRLYVYRGDGADAGNGAGPLLWSAEIGYGDTPALVDLDRDGQSEIVVGSTQGVLVFNNDGTLRWSDNFIRPHFFSITSLEVLGWGGPAVGNLDTDPEPEIVAIGYDAVWPNTADDQRLCLYQANGERSRCYSFGTDVFSIPPTPPVLADLTGDGVLDILVAQENRLLLLDNTRPTFEPVWERTVTITSPGGEGTWGAPAIADIDSALPGGDPGPEIVMAWDGFVEVLNPDGSLVWSYRSPFPNAVYPGSVSVADLDGDESVEIITVMKRASSGTDMDVYVLNDNGSLQWSRLVRDRTRSTSGVSVLDLDGDGAWEVIWNGRDDGLTILRGSDGALLFNEPQINSGTLADYPVIADVDLDGRAEIVVGDNEGMYVVGFDQGWGPSRPLWNQYDYRITNINDDLSVPVTEVPSWIAHNTYRTQTELANPVPVYEVTVRHTVPVTGVNVLAGSYAPSPTQPAPAITWSYRQQGFGEPQRTLSFAADLPDMRPGEVRRISEGTEVTYRLASGQNTLTLPPLYVAAAHIVAITPLTQTVTAGGSAIYNVQLSNPGTTVQTYTLGLGGLPDGWGNLPGTITLAAGEQITVPLTLNVPADAGATSYPFAVVATTTEGGTDQAQAELTITPAQIQLAITPELREAAAGELVTYTLTLTNAQPLDRTYSLVASGLDPSLVDLVATTAVPALSSRAIPLTVTANLARGFYPLQVSARQQDDPTVSASAATALAVVAGPGVEATLTPPQVTAGQGAPAIFTLTVTNTGQLSDTYDLDVRLPTGWTASLRANEVSQTSLSLSPFIFNRAELTLLVTPPAGTAPGQYPIEVAAISRTSATTTAIAGGRVIVDAAGVTVLIDPGQVVSQPDTPQTWNVRVTNTGGQADSFNLEIGGVIAANARLNSSTVALAAGASTTVQLSVDQLPFVLPGTASFAVTARSQANPSVLGFDTAEVTYRGFNAVAVALTPDRATLDGSGPVSYLMVISNTGTIDTIYTLSAITSAPGVSLTLETREVYVPARMAAAVLVQAAQTAGAQVGTYTLTGEAVATSGVIRGSASAQLVISQVAAPTATPTSTPTATNTPTSSPTSTNTPTSSPTSSPTSTPTATNTPTSTPTATNTPTSTPTATNTPTSTPTATNTPTSTPVAEVCPVVLDNFDRANGRLGTPWSGSSGTTSYKLVGGEVDVVNGGALYWGTSKTAFARVQSACLRLVELDSKGRHHTLMLKVQPGGWGKGAILVSYDAPRREITVQARNVSAATWRTVGRFKVTLETGDQLGAQARADGTVAVYINNELIGTADPGSFYKEKGGQIGIWFDKSGGAWFDEFAGGTP